MLGSNMSALQGFAGSDATSTALSFATGSVVRQPSLHVKQRRLFSDSVRRRRQLHLRIQRLDIQKMTYGNLILFERIPRTYAVPKKSKRAKVSLDSRFTYAV